jgi:hypothetical protein
MYIYIKNSKEMHSALTFVPEGEKDLLTFQGTNAGIYSSGNYPYAKTNETEIESIMQNKCLQKYFLKAVDITFPKFSKPRECGIYNYGKARAELRIGKEGLRLKTETSFFKSLSDMITLQEMIYAGTFAPSISYENKQIRKINIHFAKFVKLLKKFTKK